jgi:hypothetical protein
MSHGTMHETMMRRIQGQDRGASSTGWLFTYARQPTKLSCNPTLLQLWPPMQAADTQPVGKTNENLYAAHCSAPPLKRPAWCGGEPITELHEAGVITASKSSS